MVEIGVVVGVTEWWVVVGNFATRCPSLPVQENSSGNYERKTADKTIRYSCGIKEALHEKKQKTIRAYVNVVESYYINPPRSQHNQATLSTLTTGNPTNSVFAREALLATKQLLSEGWIVSGLWAPAHCGIPGNELADALAKQGAQTPTTCDHARVSM